RRPCRGTDRSGYRTPSGMAQCASLICALRGPVSRYRVGWMPSALAMVAIWARWRSIEAANSFAPPRAGVCAVAELVVDGLVVGHRDDVGADALTQFRRQGLASEQADIAVHFQFGETRFDAGWNVGQARCPLAPRLRQHRDPAGLALRAQDGVRGRIDL